jgi:ABC-type glycerol-3-phosphate transport system substrate-binding protein
MSLVFTRRTMMSGIMTGTVPWLISCTLGRQQGVPAAAKKPITLRWSPWNGEGQAIVDGADQGIAAYRRTHPHVSFELVPQDGWNAKIDAMIAADDGPDVFGGNGAGWRNRAMLGQFLTLSIHISSVTLSLIGRTIMFLSS